MADTESLPRFRPPCGVTPYSCLSDGLCLLIWYKDELVVARILPKGLVPTMAECPYLQRPDTPSLLIWREGKPHWPRVRRPNPLFVPVVLVFWGDKTVPLAAGWRPR